MLIRLLQLAVIGGGFAVALPTAPDNVSRDPSGKAPPEVMLDEREMTPERVVPEHKVRAGEDVVDWSVSILKSEAAWSRGYTGKGVTVAVLDTGIDKNHKDFEGAIDDTFDFSGSPVGSDDRVGHGTHCAGSIGARKNQWGQQGVAYECRLLAYKVLGDGGSGGTDDIAAGIKRAVEKGAKVISMSLGGGGTDPYIPVALKLAEDAGVIVVAAAGNDNVGSPVNYPAAYPFCIAISASDKQKKIASFSCTGAKIEATGPGVGVRSTYPGNRFADMSGTSMATPNLAGVAAVWTQWADEAKVPQKERPAKFRDWLKTTAEDLGNPGRDSYYGYGLPDLSKLPKGGDVPQPPAPGVDEVKLGWGDLTPEAQKKLRDAGYEDFGLSLKRKAAKVAPKIGAEELEKLVLDEKKSLVVAIGVKLDLAKWPDGYELIETADEVGVPPGVYKVGPVTRIGLEKLD
jgi:subtilisin